MDDSAKGDSDSVLVGPGDKEAIPQSAHESFDAGPGN